MDKYCDKISFQKVPEIPGRIEGEYEPDPNEPTDIIFKKWFKKENQYDTWYQGYWKHGVRHGPGIDID